MNKNNKTIMAMLMGIATLSACCDDPITEVTQKDLEDSQLLDGQSNFGKAVGNFSAEEWYSGGQLGTTTKRSYSTPTANVEADEAMNLSFEKGITFFEKSYTLDMEPRKGLGPAWVRNSCIKCHPNYGHGNSLNQSTKYQASVDGNGYLLVIYKPTPATTSDGVRYTTETSKYISEVTGMPQTQAMYPFKAPVDESQIAIEWKSVTAMPSGLPMQFPDGEEYSLIYPDVTIPVTAFNTNPKPSDYEVRLESTIGLYGTGLLDAITQEDMLAQWQKEAQYVDMNPGMWDKANNTWASSAWYTLADGEKRIKKFTYAMTRASLQDGAGANAIWNITNVTRSDRRYLYTTPAWAKAMSEDAEVIDYISANGKDASSLLHPYWAETKAEIAEKVNNLLSMNTAAKGGDNYTKAFGQPEMSNKDYYDFMVWHRGLAVPAARNLDDAQVQQGKKVFNQIGCAQCHRPSWTTGNDDYWVDNAIKAYCQEVGKDPKTCLPKFANQTIWPYTDLVQHRLFMENDIRTGWCRTTPLWGRGLSYRLTGSADRLHDCRARNEIEAIMWHGYSKDSQGYVATKKFYELSKEDREAVVKFLQAI